MNHRTRVIVYVLLGLAIALILGLLVNALIQRVNKAERKADAATTAADANHRAADALANQVRRLGHKPVVTPSELPPPPVPTETVRLPGLSPTRAQVLAAVQTVCGSGGCENAAQVEAAVSVYCAGHGGCRGAAGNDGADGSDSTVPGPAGHDATDAQVLANVTTYCDAHNQCQGPPGKDGADSTVPGPKGDKGDPGTAIPGTYTCQDPTPYLHGFTVADDGSVTLDCIALLD